MLNNKKKHIKKHFDLISLIDLITYEMPHVVSPEVEELEDMILESATTNQIKINKRKPEGVEYFIRDVIRRCWERYTLSPISSDINGRTKVKILYYKYLELVAR